MGTRNMFEEFCGLDQVLTVYEQKPMKSLKVRAEIHGRQFLTETLPLETYARYALQEFNSSRVTGCGCVRTRAGTFFPLMRGQKHPALTASSGPHASDNEGWPSAKCISN